MIEELRNVLRLGARLVSVFSIGIVIYPMVYLIPKIEKMGMAAPMSFDALKAAHVHLGTLSLLTGLLGIFFLLSSAGQVFKNVVLCVTWIGVASMALGLMLMAPWIPITTTVVVLGIVIMAVSVIVKF